MKINQLDLFSGIGGFHLGFERAGYEVTSYFSEVDKHAIAVYKHQFPNSTYVGSVTDVRGADLPNIDLITFGSPCQDFSLAGKRKGMEGDRSSLVLEAIRLIGECRPRVFVWENVKGTFSSNNGEDFAAILQAFTNIGGYRLEWQLLNTSWFLPQNRERIYLVGYSTEPKRGWRGVFPVATNERETLELQGQCVPANTILQRYTATANGTYIGERELAPQAVVEPMIYDGYNNKVKEDNIVGTITQHCSRSGMTNGFKVIEPNYKYEAANELVRKNNLTDGEVKGLDFYNQSVRDVIPTLTDPKHNSQGLFDGYRIRRLTPIECERLQGFPDDHTAYGNYDGEVKPMSNTQRYKQCGNAVTVDVVAAVAKNCLSLFK
jgi:DNA (cytosine-5)-methyltransferase 1